jgi:transcriptional regulator with XRE-family HTH domain
MATKPKKEALSPFTLKLRAAMREAKYVRPWGDGEKPMVSELARASGVERGWISKLYSGKAGKRPGRDTVVQLAEALGAAGKDLLTNYEAEEELKAGPFVSMLMSLEKLRTEVIKNPNEWRVSTLVSVVRDLLESKTLSDRDGNPTQGTWKDILDEAASGGPGPRVGGHARFAEIRDEQNPPTSRRRRSQ